MPNWNELLRQFNAEQSKSKHAFDVVRRRYLAKLAKRLDRNVIAYYSGFLSKPNLSLLGINDEDKNGFMMAVHKLDRDKGLDLMLHTPGGDIASTQSIVHYLQQMFKGDIRAIVPQIAMSAGTMLACSCREIIMGKQSNLGPIDPQLRDIPAYGAIKEFQKALDDYKKDPDSIVVWKEIIGQYRPSFLGRCQNAIDWSNSFVEEQLERVMFAGEPNAKQKASQVVAGLTDDDSNKTHSRHIHADECRNIGLKVRMMEDDDETQDLILTVHHCFMHVLMNSTAFKMIENHKGVAFVKNQTGKA